MCQQLSNDKFICPICGNTDNHLLSVGSPHSVLSQLEVIGAGTRLQKCNICGSSDRDRLVYLFLRDHCHLFDYSGLGVKILHVAPEDPIARKILDIPRLHYIPIDSFEHGYDYPPYIKEMNLLALDLDDDSIDLIICNHVLQDITNDFKALNEIHRVLKPTGQAILQVPISHKFLNILEHEGDKDENYCTKRYGHRFHKRIYSYQGYVNRLSQAGFNVEVINLGLCYKEHSLNPNEHIFLARKTK